MKTTLSQDRAALAASGIHLPPSMKFYPDDPRVAMDTAIQASLITTVNAGIPAYLANILDPTVIEVLVQPMNATKITGERGLGSWVTATAQFPVAESAGEVSSYGDYNENGMQNANYNWIPREQYVYQGICQWGDQELERMALAKIDHANQVRVAKTLNFNKFQNKSYFFGIANLQNFGLLNDPNLSPAITPSTKTAGGTSWSKATPEEIVNDVTSLYVQAVKQTGQIVSSDDAMKLALSGISLGYINRTNQFGLSAAKTLKDIYPKMEIIAAPEYTTGAGELAQMVFEKLQGQEVLISSFGDKMRAFPMFRALSSFRQKFSAGTWGCIIKQPTAISQMLGI